MSVVLQELRNHLDDPSFAAEYDPLKSVGNAEELAKTINTTQTADDIDVPEVARAELIKAVVASEYSALSAVQRDAWQMVITLENIPVKDANLRAIILDIWAAGTTTRSNLAALQTRKAFRSEQLGASSEFGDRVSDVQVSKALRL